MTSLEQTLLPFPIALAGGALGTLPRPSKKRKTETGRVLNYEGSLAPLPFTTPASPAAAVAGSPVLTATDSSRGAAAVPPRVLSVSTTKTRNPHRRRGRKGKSVYRGVCVTREGKWRAVIYKERKQLYLGVYESETEAAKAHDNAARKHFGSNAMVNFPLEGELSSNTPLPQTGASGRASAAGAVAAAGGVAAARPTKGTGSLDPAVSQTPLAAGSSSTSGTASTTGAPKKPRAPKSSSTSLSKAAKAANGGAGGGGGTPRGKAAKSKKAAASLLLQQASLAAAAGAAGLQGQSGKMAVHDTKYHLNQMPKVFGEGFDTDSLPPPCIPSLGLETYDLSDTCAIPSPMEMDGETEPEAFYLTACFVGGEERGDFSSF